MLYCDSCQNLISHLGKSLPSEEEYQRTFEEIFATAKDGCPICSLILSGLLAEYGYTKCAESVIEIGLHVRLDGAAFTVWIFTRELDCRSYEFCSPSGKSCCVKEHKYFSNLSTLPKLL